MQAGEGPMRHRAQRPALAAGRWATMPNCGHTLHSIPEHSSPTRSLSRFTTLGVCFDFQKVDEVPVDAYDIPVDEVI